MPPIIGTQSIAFMGLVRSPKQGLTSRRVENMLTHKDIALNVTVHVSARDGKIVYHKALVSLAAVLVSVSFT